ncbi:hypothetical protein SBOR_0524 [Sclerotinia borealis F-4128]|uniref:Myb-like domain-containing protein n=1 Tax=Sclerotinia borealis (strain F-4128) TaxID=1432307 RepID=W9CWT9_SCLBF|nr:hypothetical protein SBOR_0524 [Sclerotinia borealis F-4128]
MTETSRRQTDSPSETPESLVITTSKTPPTSAQSSSDNKLSPAQPPIDPLIMEQDHTEVSEEHGKGGFDPDGHYQNAYMSISKVSTDVSKGQSQQPNVASGGSPVGQNNRRRANQSKVGDGEVRRNSGPFQQHSDSGDEADDDFIGRARRDVQRYSSPFQEQSDDGGLDTISPLEMTRRGQANINDFDSPSASRDVRRRAGRYQQQQRDGRNHRRVSGRSQLNGDNSDDLDAVDNRRENDGYAPRQFQPVTVTAGLPGPRIPVAPTTPIVHGRVVKQSLRRGDHPFTGVRDNEDAAIENSDFQDSHMDDDEYSDPNEYLQDPSPDYGTPMDEDEEYDEDQGENMFASESGFLRPNRVEKKRAGASQPSRGRPITNKMASTGAGRTHPAATRRGKDAGKPRIVFGTPSQDLAPSRYSGAVMPWGVNQQPVLVDQDTVSDAHLKKRGLTRPPPGEKVGKRSYGANDPENVAIVNMKENEGLSFAQIADDLNLKRVAAGKRPGLTVCGVNGRYNRTAPILFATQGLKFVPLSERRRSGGAAAHGSTTRKAGWTVEAENRLVEVVKQVESEKWGQVARILNAELYDGRPVHDATTCAKRYASL